MATKWSGYGLDLLMTRDPAMGVRGGLEHALRQAVRSGRLPPGTRLPSTRALAADLGVARGSVSQAYDQLAAEGFLVARPGSGTVVAPRPDVAATPPSGRGAEAPPPSLDLRPGLPDLSSFPRAAWLAAARRVVRDMPNADLGYGDWRGHPALRRALAEYLGRARGAVTNPEQIVVFPGYSQALTMLCDALRVLGGAVVAFEDPSHPGYLANARSAGLTVRPVPVDGHGLEVDRLDADVETVIVTPAHQYPLGVTLSSRRRIDLIGWACDTGGLIVEDDYDGEFRYDRQPVGALQGLAPGQTVYAGTASKTLAPGLRIGWLAAPPNLVRPLGEARACEDPHVPVIDQLVLADLITSGEYDRHIRRRRGHYRRRRDRLAAALSAVPGLRPRGVAAGMHVVVELPSGRHTEAEVVAHIAHRGVAVEGLSGYRHAAPGPPALLVGYGTPPEHAFAPALDAFAAGLAELYR
ncbi:MocR-like pyridoxine biosynthesis transcription factor PdxR [Sphaerisporangium aureirubrum]|uniref:PLP-dependent aminotransferase family protein n=1 Tax=Sphaerisporangium aureirubrum TaxID=1544736 RepID=A0ABW1NQ05_9ACTN